MDATIETKIIEFANLKLHSCKDCGNCKDNGFKCTIKDDFVEIMDEMKTADGLLFSIPHYQEPHFKLQAFLDRFRNIHRKHSKNNLESVSPLKDKPCGIIVTSGAKCSSTVSFLNILEKLMSSVSMNLISLDGQPYKGVIAKAPIFKDLHDIRNARELGRQLAKTIKTLQIRNYDFVSCGVTEEALAS